MHRAYILIIAVKFNAVSYKVMSLRTFNPTGLIVYTVAITIVGVAHLVGFDDREISTATSHTRTHLHTCIN